MNQKPEFAVQLPPLPMPAYQLLMEGLAQLPLHRSKLLFDALEAEAKKQAAAYNAPPPKAKKVPAMPAAPEAPAPTQEPQDGN